MKKFFLSLIFVFFSIPIFTQQPLNESDYLTVLTPDLDSLKQLSLVDENRILEQSVARQIKDRIETNIKNYTKFRIVDSSSALANYSIIPYVDYANSVYILSLSMISFSTGEILFNVQSAGKETLEDIFTGSPSAIDEVTVLFCKQLNIDEPVTVKTSENKPVKKISEKKNNRTDTFPEDKRKIQPFSLSVEPIFGMKWGQVDEYVYEKDSEGIYQKESELNWHIKNMFKVGGQIDGGFKKLKGKIHFSALIPGECGIMEDSDWMDLNDVKTTYSKSENKITQAFDFSIELRYEFQPIKKIKIAPVLGFEYKTISFEARNGYGWYGNVVSPHVSWDDPNAVYYSKGSLCGIDYHRDVKQFLLGYYFEFKPIEKIRMYESFFVCPYAYTASYDTHYRNSEETIGTDYADEVYFFFKRFKYLTGCYYVFNKHWEIGFHISAFYAIGTTGTNYQKAFTSKGNRSGYKEQSGVKGGAGTWDIDASLSCRFTIF